MKEKPKINLEESFRQYVEDEQKVLHIGKGTVDVVKEDEEKPPEENPVLKFINGLEKKKEGGDLNGS